MTPKGHQIRVIEINVHRSKKNGKLGHAVALLFPCNHNKYLGITLYKGEPDTNTYRTQDCRVLKFDDYSVMDKEHCKLCPMDDYWLDDLAIDSTLDEFAAVLEVMEFDDSMI